MKGLIVQRHNEIQNAIGDLAALLWGQVKRELPVVSEDSATDETLIADLGIRGVWSPQSEALFDICVTNTDAQSYLSQVPDQVLFRAEVEKKHKYSAAATARRAHFTPLCFLLMASLALKLPVLSRDSPMAFPSTGIEAILKFCVGSVPDWHLQFCVPQVYV